MSGSRIAAAFSISALLFLSAVFAAVPLFTSAQEDSDGNLSCPDMPEIYFYEAGGPKTKKVNGKELVNLYGKGCVSIEAKDEAASGICVAAKTCRANLCDGKPCMKPTTDVKDVQKAILGEPVKLDPMQSAPGLPTGQTNSMLDSMLNLQAAQPGANGLQSETDPWSKPTDNVSAINEYLKDVEASQGGFFQKVGTGIKDTLDSWGVTGQGGDAFQLYDAAGNPVGDPISTDSSLLNKAESTGFAKTDSEIAAEQCTTWACSLKQSAVKAWEGIKDIASTLNPIGTAEANPSKYSPEGSSAYLAQQRAALMAELDTNPALRDKVIAVIGHEINTKDGTQAVLESMVNRAQLRGYTSLEKAINDGFYGPVNRGWVDSYLEKGIAPEMRALGEQAITAVAAGSNICNLCTDQGMPNEITGKAWKVGGESFGHMAGSSKWADQQLERMAAYNADTSVPLPPSRPDVFTTGTTPVQYFEIGQFTELPVQQFGSGAIDRSEFVSIGALENTLPVSTPHEFDDAPSWASVNPSDYAVDASGTSAETIAQWEAATRDMRLGDADAEYAAYLERYNNAGNLIPQPETYVVDAESLMAEIRSESEYSISSAVPAPDTFLLTGDQLTEQVRDAWSDSIAQSNRSVEFEYGNLADAQTNPDRSVSYEYGNLYEAFNGTPNDATEQLTPDEVAQAQAWIKEQRGLEADADINQYAAIDDIQNQLLAERLALADKEAAAYQATLKAAEANVPVPDAFEQSGEQLTQQVKDSIDPWTEGVPPVQLAEEMREQFPVTGDALEDGLGGSTGVSAEDIAREQELQSKLALLQEQKSDVEGKLEELKSSGIAGDLQLQKDLAALNGQIAKAQTALKTVAGLTWFPTDAQKKVIEDGFAAAGQIQSTLKKIEGSDAYEYIDADTKNLTQRAAALSDELRLMDGNNRGTLVPKANALLGEIRSFSSQASAEVNADIREFNTEQSALQNELRQLQSSIQTTNKEIAATGAQFSYVAPEMLGGKASSYVDTSNPFSTGLDFAAQSGGTVVAQEGPGSTDGVPFPVTYEQSGEDITADVLTASQVEPKGFWASAADSAKSTWNSWFGGGAQASPSDYEYVVNSYGDEDIQVDWAEFFRDQPTDTPLTDTRSIGDVLDDQDQSALTEVPPTDRPIGDVLDEQDRSALTPPADAVGAKTDTVKILEEEKKKNLTSLYEQHGALVAAQTECIGTTGTCYSKPNAASLAKTRQLAEQIMKEEAEVRQLEQYRAGGGSLTEEQMKQLKDIEKGQGKTSQWIDSFVESNKGSSAKAESVDEQIAAANRTIERYQNDPDLDESLRAELVKAAEDNKAALMAKKESGVVEKPTDVPAALKDYGLELMQKGKNVFETFVPAPMADAMGFHKTEKESAEYYANPAAAKLKAAADAFEVGGVLWVGKDLTKLTATGIAKAFAGSGDNIAVSLGTGAAGGADDALGVTLGAASRQSGGALEDSLSAIAKGGDSIPPVPPPVNPAGGELLGAGSIPKGELTVGNKPLQEVLNTFDKSTLPGMQPVENRVANAVGDGISDYRPPTKWEPEIRQLPDNATGPAGSSLDNVVPEKPTGLNTSSKSGTIADDIGRKADDIADNPVPSKTGGAADDATKIGESGRIQITVRPNGATPEGVSSAGGRLAGAADNAAPPVGAVTPNKSTSWVDSTTNAIGSIPQRISNWVDDVIESPTFNRLFGDYSPEMPPVNRIEPTFTPSRATATNLPDVPAGTTPARFTEAEADRLIQNLKDELAARRASADSAVTKLTDAEVAQIRNKLDEVLETPRTSADTERIAQKIDDILDDTKPATESPSKPVYTAADTDRLVKELEDALKSRKTADAPDVPEPVVAKTETTPIRAIEDATAAEQRGLRSANETTFQSEPTTPTQAPTVAKYEIPAQPQASLMKVEVVDTPIQNGRMIDLSDRYNSMSLTDAQQKQLAKALDPTGRNARVMVSAEDELRLQAMLRGGEVPGTPGSPPIKVYVPDAAPNYTIGGTVGKSESLENILMTWKPEIQRKGFDAALNIGALTGGSWATLTPSGVVPTPAAATTDGTSTQTSQPGSGIPLPASVTAQNTPTKQPVWPDGNGATTPTTPPADTSKSTVVPAGAIKKLEVSNVKKALVGPVKPVTSGPAPDASPPPPTGPVYDQDYYCLTSLYPLRSISVPAGTPFPSNCYNKPAQTKTGAGMSAIGNMLGGALGKLFGGGSSSSGSSSGTGTVAQQPVIEQPKASTSTPTTSSVAIVPNPAVIDSGNTSTISWSATGPAQCILFTSAGTAVATGTPSGIYTTPALTESAQYKLTCTGGTGSVNGEVGVAVR